MSKIPVARLKIVELAYCVLLTEVPRLANGRSNYASSFLAELSDNLVDAGETIQHPVDDDNWSKGWEKVEEAKLYPSYRRARGG